MPAFLAMPLPPFHGRRASPVAILMLLGSLQPIPELVYDCILFCPSLCCGVVWCGVCMLPTDHRGDLMLCGLTSSLVGGTTCEHLHGELHGGQAEPPDPAGASSTPAAPDSLHVTR
jgi:hypothetical protein